MICSRNKKIAAMTTALVSAAALAIHFLPTSRTNASDHIDSPTIAQDRGSDIADTWAFLDPNDNSKVVLVMSTQDFIVSSEHFGQAIFDHNIRYRFEIENTGDAQPDRFVDVTYSRGLGRQTPQTATITLPDGRSFTALTTIATQEFTPPPPVVTTDQPTGVSFFGGVADDPFFLDDTGANRIVASSLANPGSPDKSLLGQRGGRDTYAGFNSMLAVVSVPATLLRGNSDVIGINSVTQRRRNQIVRSDGEVVGIGEWVTVDRDGLPLVNNGLIPPPRKNEYNGASTVDDANGRFEADIVKSLRGFGANDTTINTFLDMAVRKGDILRLDLTVLNTGPQGGNSPNGGFGNMGGRRLGDDVVDATFTLINNGEPLGDNVPGNQVAFRDTFPFVADPIQPFRDGVDDQTRQ